VQISNGIDPVELDRRQKKKDSPLVVPPGALNTLTIPFTEEHPWTTSGS
jgi:hypothetical protein